MDGLEAARQIMSKHPEAKILMVSSLAYDDTMQEANTIGAKRFIYKPFDREQVLQSLDNIFAQSE